MVRVPIVYGPLGGTGTGTGNKAGRVVETAKISRVRMRPAKLQPFGTGYDVRFSLACQFDKADDAGKDSDGIQRDHLPAYAFHKTMQDGDNQRQDGQ